MQSFCPWRPMRLSGESSAGRCTKIARLKWRRESHLAFGTAPGSGCKRGFATESRCSARPDHSV